MRISDWSSDVCSSDLSWAVRPFRAGSVPPEIPFRSSRACSSRAARHPGSPPRTALAHRDHRMLRKRTFGAIPECAGRPSGSLWNHLPLDNRSEEHTSELQSLMRISYAVFCLKKKNNKKMKNKAQKHRIKQYKRERNILRADATF